MTARKKIGKDVWGIVFEFLAPSVQQVKLNKTAIHKELEEIVYANWQKQIGLYFDFETNVKARLRPQICKAYAKQDEICITNTRFYELSRLNRSERMQVLGKMPRCLEIVVTNIDSIWRYYTPPCRHSFSIHKILVWNHSKIQLKDGDELLQEWSE